MKRTVTPLLLCLALLVGCHASSGVEHVNNPVVQQITVEKIGACQGIFINDGSVWLYGDRDNKGVLKRLEWVGPNDKGGPMLVDTGEVYELWLYRNRFTQRNDQEQLPRNLIPHPTGLTHHEKLGTFIGNTVDQKGAIYHIVWWGFKQSGSLDDWVKNKTVDDLATNGTRPEFVRYNGRWLIATADYGDQGNQLRLYDPEKLAKASKTSEEGVLVAAFDCGPYVQSMHWIDETQTLVLAQKQTPGLGYRLTLLKFGDGPETPVVDRVIDLGNPTDELEGFGIIAPGWAVMSSAMKENNVTVIKWPIE
ncbi:MAG: hypothetical protein AAF085_02435 [Planctomycetota bacterium]